MIGSTLSDRAAVVTAMVIKGLIAVEPTGGLYLTKDGRATLRTLLGEHL